ncbi:MAG: hypothetical protein Q7R92_02705 [bacterium]|nr:hypothetical protein [bacterium]
MKFFQSKTEDGKKLIWRSVLNSLGVLAYVSLVVTFMQNAERMFGKEDNALTGVIVLMLFVLSALITGLLVLGRPIMLYLDGKKAEAVKMLIYTGASLFVLLLFAIGGSLLLR